MGRFKNFDDNAIAITGLMDTRSLMEAINPGVGRFNRNITAFSDRQVARMPGWKRFGVDGDNSDLHDQLPYLVYGYESLTKSSGLEVTSSGSFYLGYEDGYTIKGEPKSYIVDSFLDGYVWPGANVSFGYPELNDDTGRFLHPFERGESSGFYVNHFSGEYPHSVEYFEGDKLFSDTQVSDTFLDSEYHVVYDEQWSFSGETDSGYSESHYHIAFGYTTDSEHFPGHYIGDPIPLNQISSGYVESYCGDELKYRRYCSENFEVDRAREAITLLREFPVSSGVRRLVAATQSRIYALNEESGNWRILADGLGGTSTCGCGTRRFQMAQLGDYAIFSNDYDPPLYWPIDGPAKGCDLQAAVPIEELDDMDFHRAGAIAEYKGFIFMGDIEVQGIRYGSKVVWSDFADPLAWAPANDRLSGDSDVGDIGERIIAMETLGDYLFIFKERSIWRCTLIGGSQIFSFQQVYHGERTPRYKHAIVSTGDALFYMGQDTIYVLDTHNQTPQRIDWIHQATGFIFDSDRTFGEENLQGGIEEKECEAVVAGYNPVTWDLWFSWVSKKNGDGSSAAETTLVSFNPPHSVDCNNRSMKFNLRYQSVAYVDHGFTAFGDYRSDLRPTIKSWLYEMFGCELGDTVKEGQSFQSLEDPAHPDVASIWNSEEDLSKPADDDSVCAALGDTRFEDLCSDCVEGTKFLMASAADFCIKEYDKTTFSRSHFSWEGNSYSDIGYVSSIESGALNLGSDNEKYLNRLMVEFKPPGDDPAPDLNCKLGFSSQPECEVWKELTPQPLECQRTTPQGGRPYDKAYFNYLARGRYLFYKLWIEGTAGDTRLSYLTLATRRAER